LEMVFGKLLGPTADLRDGSSILDNFVHGTAVA
jgi:hypothetical protein